MKNIENVLSFYWYKYGLFVTTIIIQYLGINIYIIILLSFYEYILRFS